MRIALLSLPLAVLSLLGSFATGTEESSLQTRTLYVTSLEEREKPIGNDRGFLWRLNTHCSFEQRDADTYMQCELVSLSRGMPFLLSALIKPFVSGIPKETLTFTLESSREHLTARPFLNRSLKVSDLSTSR